MEKETNSRDRPARENYRQLMRHEDSGSAREPPEKPVCNASDVPSQATVLPAGGSGSQEKREYEYRERRKILLHIYLGCLRANAAAFLKGDVVHFLISDIFCKPLLKTPVFFSSVCPKNTPYLLLIGMRCSLCYLIMMTLRPCR